MTTKMIANQSRKTQAAPLQLLLERKGVYISCGRGLVIETPWLRIVAGDKTYRVECLRVSPGNWDTYTSHDVWDEFKRGIFWLLAHGKGSVGPEGITLLKARLGMEEAA